MTRKEVIKEESKSIQDSIDSISSPVNLGLYIPNITLADINNPSYHTIIVRNNHKPMLRIEDGNYTVKESYIEEIEKREHKSSWTLCSEGLPDTDDEVLCWYEYYHWSQEKVLPEYGIGRYFKESSAWFGEVANGHEVRVIAWMPLPKPYKE